MSIAAIGIDASLSWYFGYPVFFSVFFLPKIYDDYRNLVLYFVAVDLMTDSKFPLGIVGFSALTLIWILSWLQNFIRVKQTVLFMVSMIMTGCVFFVLTGESNFVGLLASFSAFALSFLVETNRS